MQFTTTMLFAATTLASLAVASNTISFVNQDNTKRTIIFTAQAPLEEIPPLVIPGMGTGNATCPPGWIGNFYSYSEGAENKPGILGEVRFQGYGDLTYFDISAIVGPGDLNGVKILMPKNSNEPISGCQTYPCSNAYNKWDDVATLSTPETELICLVGNLSNKRRHGAVARMPREFVEA